MIIGAGTGGGNDLLGRVVARHISKHLPGNPTVVPQNMPGAGGIQAANYIYNIAPKDGTMLGIVPGSLPIGPLIGVAGTRFDPPKFTWVGTPTIITDVDVTGRQAAYG
jgi:tripartite-type tricarboxylate transporter receptor subunit TctC